MNIFITGINYKTTPLDIREKLSFRENEQKEILKTIYELPMVDECMVISTCNRTEVYVHSLDTNFNSSVIEGVLCSFKGQNISTLKKYFYTYYGARAVKHLFKVASGLDSMVLGEDQILGQVKSAYQTSLEVGTGSSVLNTLFRDAITAAKKVKTSTALSKNSVSISTLAVKLLSEIFGDSLKDKKALIIGTGKIGSIALKNLFSKGIGQLFITNRTHGKLLDFSKDYKDAGLIQYENRYSIINECDIVISSTSSPHYTITKDMLENAIIDNKERVFIDLAVPRDFDEAISTIQGVKYYNIDDLQSVSAENLNNRLIEASKAEEILDEYIFEYEKWYEFKNVLPIVKEIKKYSDDLLNDKIEVTLSKLKCASEEDKQIVKLSLTNAVNEVLNKFLYGVRDVQNKEDIKVYFDCLKEIMKEENK